ALGTTPPPAATTPPATATDSAAASTAPTRTPTTSTSTAAQQVTGSLQQITERGRQYGQIQVKATVKGSTVIGVEITQLDLADNRSQSIADYAVPQLEQQSIDVGSAQIDGVSGATYTSGAYATSLQAALDQVRA
ncbi:MAG: FMN-binding protein, partial [Thermoleophilia bacterium]|nr:FMN-binding protein [Thermoleophilia bacterium]